MSNNENIENLLREYGYPENAIHHYIKEKANMDFEEIKKSIMPYRDITAKKR
jgi:hypothetical protein